VIAISNSPIYAHPVPNGHRFPMAKYDLIPEQLVRHQIITESQFIEPSQASQEIVLLTHCSDYVEKLLSLSLTTKEQRAIGFEQSEQLMQREFTIMQGTIDMALFALKYGCGLNIAGGTHHSFKDRGEGFCLLNDFAIASNYLLEKKLARKILIIDLDVHQGNGTAAIFKNRKDVFTFSIHGAHNYPFHKEKSDLDIGLSEGTSDQEYLYALEKNLDLVLSQTQPDLVCYLSGVDILGSDKFGKMNITMDGCKRRDEIVFETLVQKKIPCVVAMGGGYSTLLATVVNAHCNTFEMAMKYYG
jgi:acetoin utilization deacetylase AcuC-like enzyme